MEEIQKSFFRDEAVTWTALVPVPGLSSTNPRLEKSLRRFVDRSHRSGENLSSQTANRELSV